MHEEALAEISNKEVAPLLDIFVVEICFFESGEGFESISRLPNVSVSVQGATIKAQLALLDPRYRTRANGFRVLSDEGAEILRSHGDELQND